MEPWQEIVAEYDRKAHRRNGLLTVTFVGSFRAMDSKVAANRVLHYGLQLEGTHFKAIDKAVAALDLLRRKATDLDHRIELRRQQLPHERRYLYDS